MKWLLQNIGSRVVFAAKNPRYTFKALLRDLFLADERFLAKITSSSLGKIRRYLNEPISTPPFAEHLRQAEELFRGLSIESADLFAKRVLNQYVAIRALAPNVIVETGIANGVSSAYLLLALQKNGRGSLHSIGLADPAYLPHGKSPGWLVPDWLRSGWQIHVGDSRDILPVLLARLGKIGVFIHDSLHTYDHMKWEFETAYPYIQADGLLIADDALWNDSFRDLARQAGITEAKILRGVGFLKKQDNGCPWSQRAD